MRNSRIAWMHRIACWIPGVAVLALGAAGCASDKPARAELNEGYASLQNRQYDQAISRADAFIQHTPQGQGTAEALYLKGRALEQRSYPTMSQAMAGWGAARGAYADALAQSPSPRLEVLIHLGLANVAYYLEDYYTAEKEWTGTYDKVEDPDVKSWVLYRVGICRQRMGQFADADTVFVAVQQRYPDTIPASRAREHQGVHEFSVQLATFAAGGAADTAVAALRRDGVAAGKKLDAKGRSVVLAGPFASYQQAQSVKARYAAKYPDALIVP